MPQRKFLHAALLLSVLMIPSLAWGASPKGSKETAPPAAATAKEIEMGKKAVEQLEKDPRIKLLDGSKDPAVKALLEKLNTMATTLGKVSARPKIAYVIKVIEDKDINAFTLPN